MQPDVAEPDGAEPLDDSDLPDCSLLDVGCHVTNWFADFVTGALNPAFGWIAGIAFGIPPVPEGVGGLWSGTLTVTNLLFVLLVLAAGVVVMARGALQGSHGAGEILGRLAFAFIASNVSLWVCRELFTAANGISTGIAAMGIDAEVAVERLQERMDSILREGVIFLVLLLVAIVVMVVVWIIVDVVRIVMSIVLVIAAPALLIFHALPQTNRIAVLWWRSMAGLCAIPIAQSLAFTAIMKLFFEGQARFFGHYDLSGEQAAGGGPDGARAMSVMALPADQADGTTPLFDLILFLVLVYIQIRIPVWVMKLVWSPTLGSSPIMSVAKGVAALYLFRGLRTIKVGRRAAATAGGGSSGPMRLRGLLTPVRKPTSAPLHGLQPGRSPQPAHAVGRAPAGQADPPRPGAGRNPGRTDPSSPDGASGAGRRALPAGREPRALPGPRGAQGPPPSHPHGTGPARGALSDEPAAPRPRAGQLELFRPPPPAAQPEAGPKPRRWRQGVLPTPPPERTPGPRGPRRLGEVFDTPTAPPRRTRPTRGQIPLFANPKKHWVQRPLPLGRVALNRGRTDKKKEG